MKWPVKPGTLDTLSLLICLAGICGVFSLMGVPAVVEKEKNLTVELVSFDDAWKLLLIGTIFAFISTNTLAPAATEIRRLDRDVDVEDDEPEDDPEEDAKRPQRFRPGGRPAAKPKGEDLRNTHYEFTGAHKIAGVLMVLTLMMYTTAITVLIHSSNGAIGAFAIMGILFAGVAVLMLLHFCFKSCKKEDPGGNGRSNKATQANSHNHTATGLTLGAAILTSATLMTRGWSLIVYEYNEQWKSVSVGLWMYDVDGQNIMMPANMDLSARVTQAGAGLSMLMAVVAFILMAIHTSQETKAAGATGRNSRVAPSRKRLPKVAFVLLILQVLCSFVAVISWSVFNGTLPPSQDDFPKWPPNSVTGSKSYDFGYCYVLQWLARTDLVPPHYRHQRLAPIHRPIPSHWPIAFPCSPLLYTILYSTCIILYTYIILYTILYSMCIMVYTYYVIYCI